MFLKYDGSAAAQTAAPASDFYGAAGLETLTGTAAHESFWGAGGDRMAGGAGDDTYYRQDLGNQIVELAGEGVDRIQAWASTWLGDHPFIENLSVGGQGTYAAGNGLDNIIEGQADGQQLYGGFGQDVLIGGAGADTFIVVKGQGNDAIADFEVAADKVRLSAGFTSFDQVKAAMTQVGADVKLSLGGTDGLVFRNVQVGQFTAANFQLELDRSTLGAQTFADEFSGALSLWDAQSNPTGTWRPDFGYQGEQGTGSYTLISNNEKQIYTSPYFRGHNGDFAESPFTSNADGTLSIWARPSDNAEIFGYDYTSGFISTKESHAQTYGYFEMRADLPDAAGAWPAFWLIPADGSWPPELDVMEALTYDEHAAWTTQHSGLGGHVSNGVAAFVPDTASGFHTYGALWTASDIVWYIDNVEVFRTATPADMNKPMFMIANLALGGWGGAITEADLPAELKIDYIRAYGVGSAAPAPAPTPAPTPTPAPPPTPPATATTIGQDLNGAATADTLMGGLGDDRINGGAGEDLMRGSDGNDVMSGGDGFDNMHGNVGNDTVAGNDGHDWVLGGKGDDRLYGDEGSDLIYGALGSDLLDGGAGADAMSGGQADDMLFGWAGDDWMSGDRGSDTMSGGSGADTFYTFAQTGLDVVTDFSAAEGDRVLMDAGVAYSLSQTADGVVIDMGAEGRMVLQGVQLASLADGWLAFG